MCFQSTMHNTNQNHSFHCQRHSIDKREKLSYNTSCECAKRQRTTNQFTRKVRASQSGIADNISRGRPQGKCNRKYTATQVVRRECRGKSSPAYRRLCGRVNPIRCNTNGLCKSMSARQACTYRWLELYGDVKTR